MTRRLGDRYGLQNESLSLLSGWTDPAYSARIESPVAPCGIAAKGKLEGAMREFEELLAAWDGNGAPSDAMVAWASSFPASWDGGESESGGLRED